MIAGTQGGKTSLGPWWLKREIYDIRGSGDYIAVTSSFDLFKLKMLPSMLAVFEQILGVGRFWAADRIIELKDPISGEFLAKRAVDPMWGRIILRSAEAISGLESATAKGAWLDECGQEGFGVDAYRAVRRRLALNIGRILMTTTLYTSGWLTDQIIDPTITSGEVNYYQVGDSEIDLADSDRNNTRVIQFDSILNPMFPKEEFEEARATMPDEEFQMQYRGRKGSKRFLIYDNFSEQDIIPPFRIPDSWPRFIGLDYGPVHTCAVYYAEEPETRRLYAYREYLAGNRTTAEHVKKILDGEIGFPRAYGGTGNEDQWRRDMGSFGLPVMKPSLNDVDLGINRVYAQHALRGIVYFSTLTGIIDQKNKYRRKRTKGGVVTDEIENKNAFHYLDAERYLISTIRPGVSLRMKVVPIGELINDNY
jgi:hypothetical protein